MARFGRGEGGNLLLDRRHPMLEFAHVIGESVDGPADVAQVIEDEIIARLGHAREDRGRGLKSRIGVT